MIMKNFAFAFLGSVCFLEVAAIIKIQVIEFNANSGSNSCLTKVVTSLNR